VEKYCPNHFQRPCDAISNFLAKCIIAFEVFGMFVSTYTPSVLWGGGKVVLVFEIIYLIFDL